MSLETRVQARLAERAHNHLYRQRRVLQSAQAERIRLQNQPNDILNFCSNDYLGLAKHPKLIESLQQASKAFGVGSGASHLVIGHHQAHHDLEQKLAQFLNVEACLVFGSGYAANVGILTSLLDKGDAVFQDKLNHASLLDGGLFSGARFQRYLHNDMKSLSNKLENNQAENRMIVSDAVFSMDGDSADIPTLLELAQRHQTWLMLDDAHGFGVLGEGGRGSVNAQGVTQNAVPVYMATFGKALGTSGAFVAGSKNLIEYLIQFCRHYIYTTAMPPAMAVCTQTALDLLQQESWRQTHLQKLIQFFKQEAQALGLMLLPSDTAIQPLVLNSAEQALAWSEALLQEHILVTAIRPPTVPANSSRLRITLSAAHSESDIEHLLCSLKKIQECACL